MASEYDRALRVLYESARESFVVERKRLAAELKAGGDRQAAARLAKLPRPTLSAWVVNQLWWHSPDAFERLFETARALRSGKLHQAGDHRRVVAELNSLAQTLLRQQGHGSGDAISRRVMMTLSALAASGGFEPDVPGTLSEDRDPPGFEAFGIDSSTSAEPRTTKPARIAARREPAPDTHLAPLTPKAADEIATNVQAAADAKRVREAAKEARQAREAAREEAKRAREAEALARQREAEQRALRLAERRRHEHQLAELEKELSRCEDERSRLLEALSSAERKRAEALQRVSAARAELAELPRSE